MARRLLASAGRALRDAQRRNRSLGHENLGFLSASHGFLPVAPPRHALPATHAVWDEVAERLPELHRSLGLWRALDRMPQLPADPQSLPDEDLQRAATLLGIFAHAYRYVSPSRPVDPPSTVTRPWEAVCARLRRAQPALSYIDLIGYNWRLLDPAAPDPMRVANLRLLVPTVDNQEEHVFYLTQTEILARSTPVVSAVARAQDAVVAEDPDGLSRELLIVGEALRAVVRRSLPTISPRPRSATCVDPVVWAKTVAPFAVPLRPGQLGPSGTSSPVFSLLDVFFGRRQYDSQLGREIRGHRGAYPPNWRRFLAAVEEVSVPAYVERIGDAALTDLFRQTLDVYAGPNGFLGRHRRKVFGYLETAFKVGRSVTIGGFSGALQDRAWHRVDHALDASRLERVPRSAVPEPERSGRSDLTAGHHRVSDLVLHNDRDHGYWIGIGGEVYDVTSLLLRHPGGPTPLQAYAGRDATATYHRLHGSSSAADRLRRSCRLGPLRPVLLPADAPLSSGRAAEAGEVADGWARLLDLVVEMQNALRQDYSLHRAVGSGREAEVPRSPYLLDRAIETHERFLQHYLRPLTQEADTLWRVTVGRCATDLALGWMSSAMEATWATPAGTQALAEPDRLRAEVAGRTAGTGDRADHGLTGVEGRCAHLEEHSLVFLHDLKLTVREGVIQFEDYGRDAVDPRGHLLIATAQRLPVLWSALLMRLRSADDR